MATMIDCKVEARRWVLVSNPSKWGLKGQRVTVYSPRLTIPQHVSLVPVKRSQDEGNSVCFLPKDDIERDSSRIYEEMQISRASLSIYAHGVAIVDGFDNGFRFSRGDRFWIYIMCGVEQCQLTGTVPVINLKTFQQGTIAAQNVCWFPKIQGPNEELWTPGGEIQSQKLYGSNKFIFWSFVIRQTLDGAPPTVDIVQVPGKDSNMLDRHELALADRRSLFSKRLQCLTPNPSIEVPLLQPHQPRRLLSDRNTPPGPSLPTPPVIINLVEDEIIPAVNVEERGPPILPLAYETQPPKPTPASSYTCTSSHQRKNQRKHTRRLSIDTDGESDDEPLSSDEPVSFLFCYSSDGKPSFRRNKRRRSELSRTDKDDDFCARMLMELAKEDRYNRSHTSGSKSFLEEHFGNDLDSIHERYAQEKRDPAGRVTALHRARNANLCALKDPDCKYSIRYTAKHYHSPADKCLSGSRHEHCVCRLYPEPGGRGDCLLRLKRPRHHQCCYWGIQRETPSLDYYDRGLIESPENTTSAYALSSDPVSQEFYQPYDDTRQVGEITSSVLGEGQYIQSTNEVMLGETFFYPPYVASFPGFDSDGLSFLDGSQSS